MPLSALLRGRRVDLIDQRDEALWGEIRAPGASLACMDCGRPMHSRVSPLGLRFFAHNPASHGPQVDCAMAGESPDHLRLKLALAAAAREAGWAPEVEAMGHSWRADVLARRGNRAVALEAQLAGQSPRDALMRTHRYRADQIETFWFTTASRPNWGGETGWVTVNLDRLSCPGPWLHYDPDAPGVPVARRATGTRSLARVIDVLLEGQLVWHPAARRAHEGWLPTTSHEQLRAVLLHRLAAALAGHRKLQVERVAARRRRERARRRRENAASRAQTRTRPNPSSSMFRRRGPVGLSQPSDPADLALLQQTSRAHVLRQIAASGNRIGAAPIMELLDGGWEFAYGVVAITAAQTVVVIVPYTVPEALTDSVRKVLRGVDLVIADTTVTADQLTADGIPAATLQSVNGPQGTLW